LSDVTIRLLYGAFIFHAILTDVRSTEMVIFKTALKTLQTKYKTCMHL